MFTETRKGKTTTELVNTAYSTTNLITSNIPGSENEYIKFSECIFTFIKLCDESECFSSGGVAGKENQDPSKCNVEKDAGGNSNREIGSLRPCIDIKSKLKIIFEDCAFDVKIKNRTNKSISTIPKNGHSVSETDYLLFKDSSEGVN